MDTGVKGGDDRESRAELLGETISPPVIMYYGDWGRGEVCEMLPFSDMGEEFDQVLKLEYPKFGF